MKTIQFILIFALIDISISDCSYEYNIALNYACSSISPTKTTEHCYYYDQKCLKTEDCSAGKKENCGATFPLNFLTHKCVASGSSCIPEQRKCNEYSKTDPITVDGTSFYIDQCTSLSAGTEGDRCDFSVGGECLPFKNACSGLTGDKCTSNIPYDSSVTENEHLKKCDFVKDAEGKPTSTCSEFDRECDDTYLFNYYKSEMDEVFCQKLKETDNTFGKSCHFNGEKCVNSHRICGDFAGTNSAENCLNVEPLYLDDGVTPFDKNIYKCVPDGASCKSERKKCSDYKKENNNRELCESFVATEIGKVCVYDTKYESNNCKEEINTCNGYFSSLTGTNKGKTECESFKPRGAEKNCVWEKSSKTGTGGTCKEAYMTCDAFNTYFSKGYEDIDKKKCVSIGDGNECILDKDEKCITKYLTCEEATNIYECENTAKPTKVDCSGTNPALECTFLPQKRCEFIIGKGCIENYKYCSDYRAVGVDEDTAKEVCERIKPYNSAGNVVEEDYKCIYDANIGCQKVKKSCNEAKNNRQCEILCDALSDNKKYYYYNGVQCITYFKVCRDASVSPTTTCTENIREDSGQCQLNDNSNPTQCQNKAAESTTITCPGFTEEYKKTTCERITSDTCFYSRTLGCIGLNSCSQILKSDFPDLDEKFCNGFEASDNKICSLKADGSGCEEKSRAPICPEQLTPLDPKNQENPENQCYSYGLRVFGVQLIISLLCLLI